MRIRLFLAIVTLGLMVSASAAGAETIDVPSKHFSIDLPSGWIDATTSGSGSDLELAGPSGMICYIDAESSVSDDSFDELNDMMEQVLVELQGEGYAVSVSVATQNITVNGVKGIDTSISMSILTMAVKERIVIFASEEWDMGWIIVFAGMDPGFTQADSGMDSIVNSFSVDEKDDGGLASSTVILLGVGIVAIVVIVLVVVLLMMRKKQTPRPPMQGPPPYGPMPPAPPPPTQ